MQTVVNNNLIFYQKLGNKKNSLVILHGWGRTHKDWLQLGTSLSKNYTVYLIDLPGFGNSKLKSTSNLDTYDYAEIINNLFNKLGLTKIVLLGHSFGGKISLVLTSKYPKKIYKIILVDNSGLEIRSKSTSIKLLFIKLFKIIPLPNKIKVYIKQAFSSPDYKKAGTLSESFKKIISQHMDKEAKKINLPTLIIWGDQDQEVPIIWAKKARELIKNSTLRVVYGAKHHPHLDKPQEFEQILQEFI